MTRSPAVSRTSIEQAQLADRFRGSQKKVWGYIRVSSEKQEDEQSFDVQRAGITAFCLANQLDEPEFVQETASAKNPAIPISVSTVKSPAEASPRPLLLMLLGFLCDQPLSHFVVWKLDRLARLSYEQELMLDLLQRGNVYVHSTQVGEQEILDRSKDADDPARVMFRQVLGAVAQYERRLIEIRMKTGTRMKASKGGWVGGGTPFGYTVKAGDLVADPKSAHIVCLIFYMRFRCDDTYTGIATRLAREFKSPGWHKVRVKRVLDNRQLYEGIYVDPYGAAHVRHDLQIIPVNDDTWDAWAVKNGLKPSESTERLINYADTEN